MIDEEALSGNATTGVVRLGQTIRRPAGPWTAAVDELLRHLECVGFNGSPRALGRDEQGRQVLEHIQGDPGTSDPDYSWADLCSVGGLLRDFHDAVASFVPSPDMRWNVVIQPNRTELICHGDPAPSNIVRAHGRLVLIDWDFAGPGSRLWELAYAAQTCAVPVPDPDIRASATRLRAVIDGYDVTEAERPELVRLLPQRTNAMVDLLRTGASDDVQPWARIWAEDGPHWQKMTRYLERHRQAWLDALLSRTATRCLVPARTPSVRARCSGRAICVLSTRWPYMRRPQELWLVTLILVSRRRFLLLRCDLA